MSAIKKKMHLMKLDKENMFDKVDQLEQKLIEAKNVYEKQCEEISVLEKRITQLQNDVTQANQQVEETNTKLETKSAQLSETEGEVVSLTKKMRGLEEELESADSKYLATSAKLEEAVKASDECERVSKVLENRQVADEERIAVLEKEVEQTVVFGEEADRKYEETARKLATIDVDLERSLSTLIASEGKILELEEELEIVGNNMKSLEISEQEAISRQENYEDTIAQLTEDLKDTESRATEAEKALVKLQKEVDRLEDEVAAEKDKVSVVNGELDSTFAELTGF